MKPEEYCYQKIAPLGSAIYYSIRKLTHSEKNAVVALLAFYAEVEEITLDYQDQSIAQAKINWWKDQIVKIQDGEPSHPIAITLKNIGCKPYPLIEIIEGLEENFIPREFATFEEVVIQIMRTAGKRELLIADFLQSEKISKETIYQFTLLVELVNYIQHLRHYVKRGLIYFSEQEIVKFKISENEFREYKTKQNIANLLQFQGDKIERSHEIVKALIKTSSLHKIRSEIAIAIWRAIQSENFKVLENFITITPLRCWWIATFKI